MTGAPRFARLFAGLGAALSERLFPRRLDGVAALGRFAGQRAAFVAQHTLFGYLKTRMGTKFPEYFGDARFAAEIRAGAVRQFVACAADISVYVAAVVARDGLAADQAADLARRCHQIALAVGLADVDTREVPADAAGAFESRLARTVWPSAAQGENAFAASIEGLIGNAPVVDEFKAADASIVRNSIRFAWRDVRAQLDRRLDAAAVRADLEARPAAV